MVCAWQALADYAHLIYTLKHEVRPRPDVAITCTVLQQRLYYLATGGTALQQAALCCNGLHCVATGGTAFALQQAVLHLRCNRCTDTALQQAALCCTEAPCCNALHRVATEAPTAF
jgi:hypothetical protein